MYEQLPSAARVGRSVSEVYFNMQDNKKEPSRAPKVGRSVSDAGFNMQSNMKELISAAKERKSVSEACFNMQGSKKVQVVPNLGVVGECDEVRERKREREHSKRSYKTERNVARQIQ